jgi:hypothetical protein
VLSGRPRALAVERRVLTFEPATGLWTSSFECAFYLSNRPIRAGQAADSIRKHWGIENKQHYTRDVTFHEDASRIRRAPGIFARLRSFACNILRFNQSHTITQDRYAACLWPKTVTAQPSTRDSLHQRRNLYCSKIGKGVRYRVGQDDLVAVTHCATSIDNIGHITFAFGWLGTDKRFVGSRENF